MRANLRLGRANIAYGHDIFMAAASLPLSLWLRMGASIETVPQEFIIQSTLLFAVVAVCVFLADGSVSRHLALCIDERPDGDHQGGQPCCADLCSDPVHHLRAEFLPRSLPLINWFVLMALLGGPRFLYRLLKDRHFELVAESERQTRGAGSSRGRRETKPKPSSATSHVSPVRPTASLACWTRRGVASAATFGTSPFWAHPMNCPH